MAQNQQAGLTLQRPSQYVYIVLPTTTTKNTNLLTNGFSISAQFPVKQINVSVQYVYKIRTGAPGAYTADFDNYTLTCSLPCFNEYSGVIASLNNLQYVSTSTTAGFSVYGGDFNDANTTSFLIRDPTILSGSRYNFQLISSGAAALVSFAGIVRLELLG